MSAKARHDLHASVSSAVPRAQAVAIGRPGGSLPATFPRERWGDKPEVLIETESAPRQKKAQRAIRLAFRPTEKLNFGAALRSR